MRYIFILLIFVSCNFFSSTSENSSVVESEKKSFKNSAKPNIDNEFAMEHERVLKSWLTDLDNIQDLGFKYKASFRIFDYVNNYPTLPLEIKNEALAKIKPNFILFEKIQNYLDRVSPMDINYIFQENDLSLVRQLGTIPLQHFKNNLCSFEQLISITKDEKYLSQIFNAWSDIQNFLKAHDQYYMHNYFASFKTLLKTNKIITEANIKDYEALIQSYLLLYLGGPEDDVKEKTKTLLAKRSDVLRKKGMDVNGSNYHKVLISCAWTDVQYMRNLFAKVITWHRMQWMANKIKARFVATPELLKRIDSPNELIRYLKLDKNNIVQASHLDGWRNDFKININDKEIELKSSGEKFDFSGDDLVFKVAF
jgi:hypothetical protein